MIYLDNAATTFPKPECVYEAVDHFHRTAAVNAGRGAYHASREATKMIRDVRSTLIGMVKGKNKTNVVFTPSATIAANQIIGGFAWTKDMTAYVSPYEHNAVLRPLEMLRRKVGFQVRQLPLADDLSIDLEKTREMFEVDPPAFVCACAVSNVTGYILPAAEIFGLAKEYKAFTLMDAAQAFGFLKIDMKSSGADAIIFAGHKSLYSTFGIAGYFLRYGVELEEYLAGGNGVKSLELGMPGYAPERYEVGSMDTPAIASLQASLSWLDQDELLRKEGDQMERLITGLESIPKIRVYKAPETVRQSNVVSFCIEGVESAIVGTVLDKKYDIAVRTGYHCAGLVHEHLADFENRGTVRVSIGAFTTDEDIDALLKALREMDPEKLKYISPGEVVINC